MDALALSIGRAVLAIGGIAALLVLVALLIEWWWQSIGKSYRLLILGWIRTEGQRETMEKLKREGRP